jgi:Helix-turn-helix domain
MTQFKHGNKIGNRFLLGNKAHLGSHTPQELDQKQAPNTLGQTLLHFRKLNNLSGRVVCEVSGIGKTKYYQMEAGQCENCTIEDILALATGFGVSWQTFMEVYLNFKEGKQTP